MAKETSESDGGVAEKAATGGLVANPVIAWSLYTLKTNGCSLPPGPGDSIGALEGMSYLPVVAIVGWSLYTIAGTGSGLPNGPFGFLAALEGLSFLSLLPILVGFGFSSFKRAPVQDPSQVTCDSAEENVAWATGHCRSILCLWRWFTVLTPTGTFLLAWLIWPCCLRIVKGLM